MIETIAETGRLLSFAAFVALAARLPLASDAADRRRRINTLLAYTLVVSAFAGLTQIDNWPFASYTLAAFLARTDKPVTQTEFFGVDGHGSETFVDPLAWSPLYSSILQFWFERNFASLSPSGRDAVLRFLLARAEEWRTREAAGRPSGFERYLGAASNPYWWLLPRAKSTASAPFVRLRVYRWSVVPDRKLDSSDPGRRQLIAEGPP